MKTAIGIFTVLFFSPLSASLAAPPKKPFTCTSERPPTVTVYPGQGADGGEEILLVFKTPDEQKWKPAKIQSVKVKDTDGQVNLLLLNYLAQNPTDWTYGPEFKKALLASLKKRLAYWKTKEADKSVSSDDRILITTSVQMNEFLIKKFEKDGDLSKSDMKALITDTLGPFTDYNELIDYEYSEYKNGKFVPQPAKKLSRILPPEFHQTATSTKTGGVFDVKAIGPDFCAPLPLLGARDIPTRTKDDAIQPQNDKAKK
ncbi:MAG TPA: hypothetical protein PL182_11955 [Pseudobdellovibrionaceae bacterium]|nr:hypothetical protein [Pseudobdellovibrionaceae bacterium]